MLLSSYSEFSTSVIVLLQLLYNFRFSIWLFFLSFLYLYWYSLYFLLILFTWFPLVLCESESCSVVSNSLRPHGLYSTWNFLGQNTGMGNLSLLQGIFPAQGSNSGHLHCRQILYQVSHKGSPKVLEWVAYPFSSTSSQPRNQMGSPALQVDSLPTELSGKPGTELKRIHISIHDFFRSWVEIQ